MEKIFLLLFVKIIKKTGSVFLGSFSVTAFLLANVYLLKRFQINLPADVLTYFPAALFFCSVFWKIGGKTVFFKMLFSYAIFIGMKYFVVKNGMSNNYDLYLFVSSFFVNEIPSLFGYLYKKLFKRTSKLNLTMEEIDALGNGDTYEKGRQFEEYVASLYRAIGYQAHTTTDLRNKGLLPESIQKRGGSGEQGVDVIVEDNNGFRWIIQCKHYSGKVDNSAVQQIFTALNMYKADQAVVITNQFFTKPAKELAEANNVILIDRYKLPEVIALAVSNQK